METTVEKLLENIAAIRKNKGLSQEYVASRIGLEQPSYSLIETGNRSMDYSRLLQIAMALDVRVIDIITYPEVYVSSRKGTTKVLIELDVNEDEFVKMGLKDKVIQMLEKDNRE